MNEKDLHDIERFIRNEMNPEEHRAFVKRLEEDDTLRNWLEIEHGLHQRFHDIPDVLKKKETNDALLATLTKAEDAYFEPDPPKKRRRAWVSIAAAVAIFAVLAVVVSQLFTAAPSLPDLYATYNDWEDIPSVIEMDASPTQTEEKIERAFFQGNYDEVLSLYTKENITGTPTLLLTAISYQETNRPTPALEIFERIEASDALDKSMAYWYKLLFYMKSQDLEQTQLYLEKVLQNPDHFNFQKAQELQKELAKGFPE